MAAANALANHSETDALASLEDRIRRAVDLMAELRVQADATRAERDAAIEERTAARVEADQWKRASAKASEETAQLRKQLAGLEAERQQVRVRIEKLLGQMDQLSGS